MKLSPGEVVEKNGILREITEARPSGYTWRYPDVPDQDFWSENSSDPHFERGWRKVAAFSLDMTGNGRHAVQHDPAKAPTRR